MILDSLVIRTGDVKKLAEFYGDLGANFSYQEHTAIAEITEGSGSEYLASLKICPLAGGQAEADKHLRLGFYIFDFEEKISVLKGKSVVFLAEPAQTDYGYKAVVVDPDGREVELYRAWM